MIRYVTIMLALLFITFSVTVLSMFCLLFLFKRIYFTFFVVFLFVFGRVTVILL